MQTLISSAMTTCTVLILLFPTILCHLGSALKAGSGTLTKFTLGDHIFYCAFTNLGEGKPPILSHVRVSREPQPHRLLYNSEFDFGGPSFQANRIKSPSYQHKMLQFHGNGQTNGGLDYYPSKSIVTQYQPASKSMPVYPVASKFGKVDVRNLIGSSSTGGSMSTDDDNGGNDSWEMYSSNWEPQLLPERDEPSFTPFIGARALTNMPKFFEHLRENIKALYAKGDEDSSSSSGEDSRAGEDSNESYGTGQVLDGEKIATPTRRGYSAHHLQHPRLFHDGEQASWVTNRDGRSLKPFSLGSQPSSSTSTSGSPPNPDERTKELLRFLRYSPEYPEANNYNPSFLFTNLGLGKRSPLLSPPRLN